MTRGRSIDIDAPGTPAGRGPGSTDPSALTIWTMTIPGPRPPRPGEGHWSKVHKAKRLWTDYVAWLAHSRHIPRCNPGERRAVAITFYRPGVPSDEDNAAAACKVPLDALKRAGLIEDDSPRHIELRVDTITASQSRTVITLRQL